MTEGRYPRGFTLIEVLVALMVVASAIAALLTALNSAATSTQFLRDKTFAGWVATNRLIETRLATNPPADGMVSGELEYGGQRWQWRQVIRRAEFPGLRRIDVSVRTVAAGAALPPVEETGGDWTMTVSGALGAQLARPNGAEPDWEPPPTGPPGPQGPQGPNGGPPAPAPTPGAAT